MTDIIVSCPLCDETIQIPKYNAITRSDALAGHMVTTHVSQVRPATPLEGPPLPRWLHVHWPWKKQ